MGKTNKKLPEDSKLETNQKLRNKLADRKQQVLRLKRVIVELEKQIEKLIEELKCFRSGIEYKPKDISRPKKLTPEEKKKLKEESKVNEKEELKKKLKEKFGRKENS